MIWTLVIVVAVGLLFCLNWLYLNRRLSEAGPSLVIVHQHAGPTLEGVLTRRTTDAYYLENPKMLEAENMTVPLDGTVEIPRERVLFVQLVARGA